jgi:hypothetical protein
MSSSEHPQSEFKRSVYDSCDPDYLRRLREEAGMDLIVLARTACLSVAQVRQLESHDSDNLFYSDAIKRQAYKRLLMILGAEPPTVEVPHELHDAKKVADAHLNTLDQIVAMSHQPAMNRTASDVLVAGVSKLKEHKQALGALLLFVAAVVLFLFQGSQQSDESLSAASVAATPASVSASELAPVPAKPVVASGADVVAPVASSPAPVASLPAPVVAVPAPLPVASAATAVPSSVASAMVASKASACAYSSDALPQVAPYVAHKEGRYVYVVSTTNAEICVVDGNKQVTVLQMKAGENRSVYGVSPWQISSSGLSKLQVFFQGGRVTVPETATRIQLIEVPVSR